MPDRRKSAHTTRGTGTKNGREQPIWPYGTAEQAALLCNGISSRTLRDLVAKGTLPAPERPGWYHLPATVRAYFAYALAATASDGDETAAEVKLRKERALADLAELEADEKAESLIPLEFAEAVSTAITAGVRLEIDANAGRLAPELAALTDAAVIRRRLLDEYRACCARAEAKLADLRAPVLANSQPEPDDFEAAADEDSSGVG